MGISLMGIIAVQIYWFNNSVKVRNELFDRSVNEAMNKTVNRLETGQDLKIIKDFYVNDTVNFNPTIPPPPPPPPGTGVADIKVFVKRDTITGKIRVMTSKIQRSGYKMPHSANILFSSINSHLKTFSDTVSVTCDSINLIGFNDFNTKIDQKIDQLKKLSTQIAVEYKNWETGRSIDENQLKIFLREELNEKAIPIDFNYTIDQNDSILKSHSKLKGSVRMYKVNLFPNDIFRKNLELSVSFPERDLFIGRTTTLLLVMSTIFTLIIFLTFIISIFLIIRQKKISEMKSDFINNMTHEFKTPIATISIAADSISNDLVIRNEEQVRFFTGMIKKENRRMNEQVERILQIARLDRKEFDLNFQAVNVHKLIEEAIQTILLQVQNKGGKIETRLEAVNPVVTTDPVHFTNLIFNLLDNANKYSPEVPEIMVTTFNSTNGINITVTDKGIGMTKAVQSRIFDKFYRLPSGNIHNVKGFGLGLSYVKAILDSNEGSIKVSGEPGKGSRFVVFIPFIVHK